MFELLHYFYMYMEDATFIVNPEDIKKIAVQNGARSNELDIPAVAILTFNRTILRELSVLCSLHEIEWKAAKYTPYSAPLESWQGAFKGIELCVFVPPMGASPLAAFCEELVVYGARIIFLLCASWSLGERYLRKGQIHVPSFAVGLDGTSYHYGNVNYRIDAEPVTHACLVEALETEDIDWKQGGVGCCEAIYRITRQMMEGYRKQGCLSMENGEVAALYTIAKVHGISVGVLLQPYIDLERGYDSSYMGKEYEETCRVQARVAVRTLEFSQGV